MRASAIRYDVMAMQCWEWMNEISHTHDNNVRKSQFLLKLDWIEPAATCVNCEQQTLVTFIVHCQFSEKLTVLLLPNLKHFLICFHFVCLLFISISFIFFIFPFALSRQVLRLYFHFLTVWDLLFSRLNANFIWTNGTI